MNLSDLQAECGRLLNDPLNQRWTTDILTTRINLAQIEIQGLTNAIKTSETLTPVVNTRTVVINANTMDIIRVTKTLSDSTTIRPLPGITREELEFRFPDWQDWSNGEPIYWFYDATNQTLNLVPKPDAANVIVNGLNVWESKEPANLVNPTDIPFDSNNQMTPYHIAIAHWVVAQCWMDDGTPESMAKSKFHKSGNMLHPGQYENQVGRIMAQFDVPESIPNNILWTPQGGRTGSWFPTKAQPFL